LSHIILANIVSQINVVDGQHCTNIFQTTVAHPCLSTMSLRTLQSHCGSIMFFNETHCFTNGFLYSKNNPLLNKADWCRYCIHLKSYASTILKWLKLWDLRLWHRGYHQLHDLPTKFHKNLPTGSKVIGRRDRQTDRWFDKPPFISLKQVG
jgi:hypothetical protein